ncbi:MAG TPA: isoprenylcysteine carboxylmethyltransferase family protein [Candidatus Angelobacter sp.]|nr:isoprenylcysteine carboxylmethyltransferase family protein [Candidatus Angelobacter sp.]
MTIESKNRNRPNAAPAAANPGLVRPPIVYLVSLGAGVLIQLAIPLPFLPHTLGLLLGAALIAVALLLFFWSAGTFRAAGTPIQGNQPTTAIVRTGSYRLSRNPIYLAFSLFELGIAIWVNSLWLLAALAGAMAVMHYIVIPREESYLEREFGAQYLDYKAAVRRWI